MKKPTRKKAGPAGPVGGASVKPEAASLSISHCNFTIEHKAVSDASLESLCLAIQNNAEAALALANVLAQKNMGNICAIRVEQAPESIRPFHGDNK